MALPLTLHVFSGAWSLPSVDPASINAACYLQLALPGRWSLCESNDPDSSPNGQLPYLQHGPHLISSLSSILAYLAKLAPESASLAPSELTDPSSSPTSSRPRGSDLDEDLSDGKRAEGVAWKAVIEGELADLVSYSLFSPTDNYALFHDHLAKNLSFPQSHYLPNRLRAVHQQRLINVGLWDIADTPSSSSSSRRERDSRLGIMGTVQKLETPLQSASKTLPAKFGQQELVSRAKSTLSILSSVLASSSSDFFFDSPSPTTTDLYLFSHLALILLPPFPSSTLPEHIRTSYPNLQAHTLRVLSLCFPPDSPHAWPHRTEQWDSATSPLVLIGRAFSALPGVARGLWSGSGQVLEKREVTVKKEKTKKEKEFMRTRVYWLAGVATTFVVYLFASGLIEISLGDDEDEEYEQEEAGEEQQEALEEEVEQAAHGQQQ